jgi:hypothetical protein
MLRAMLAKLRAWWTLDDPDERIEGSGEVYLDPAYNGRYAAERNLNALANAEEDREEETE